MSISAASATSSSVGTAVTVVEATSWPRSARADTISSLRASELPSTAIVLPSRAPVASTVVARAPSMRSGRALLVMMGSTDRSVTPLLISDRYPTNGVSFTSA